MFNKSLKTVFNLLWYTYIIILCASSILIMTLTFSNSLTLPLVYYFSFFLSLIIPFMYFGNIVRKIIALIDGNHFFSKKTAILFDKLSKSILMFMGYPLLKIIHMMYMPIPINNSSDRFVTKNMMFGSPLQFFGSLYSPLLVMLAILILGFLFRIIAQAFKQAEEMQAELDDIV